MSLPITWIACGQYLLDVGAADRAVGRAQIREVVRERVHPHVDDVRAAPRDPARAPGCPTRSSCATPTRSRRPPFRNETISLRYASGRMKSGFASMCASSGSAYFDSRKNQLRSLSSQSTGVLCDRADPRVAVLDELALGVERLAADAVPALVRREVEVVGVVARGSAATARATTLLVLRVGRADEAIVRRCRASSTSRRSAARPDRRAAAASARASSRPPRPSGRARRCRSGTACRRRASGESARARRRRSSCTRGRGAGRR